MTEDFGKIRELIERNRSYRRFHQEEMIEMEVLEGLVELSRLSASGGNLQPLKYILSCDPETNAMVFACLGWAAYLKDWSGPPEGERPSAYIVVLGDKEISPAFGCDHGIAAQSILLGAVEKGFGGCIIGSISREELKKALEIPDRYEILLVIALGKPKEKIVIEAAEPEGSIRYWRDEKGAHHVPKRTLGELIIKEYGRSRK